MSEIARYIVGPTVVLFIVAANPFAWAIHHFIALVKRLTGTTSAIALYCVEVAALYMWGYGDQLQGAIDAGVYDGPMGFGGKRCLAPTLKLLPFRSLPS
ncbi:hypothetical protein [Rhizobium leguminosarum]|uniref:Putative integral membrane protein n=1 Tax=Rhizobium leguminosarum TaxID=384 RepID=A0A2Z4YFS1_RHILE|nr:hypothetical protein [Rhizobium leguminosarum]AXA39428.1 putative integral membrane protein [Rhizobium leguminosarum]